MNGGSFNHAVSPGHFTAGTHNHPVNPRSWHHNANWWHANSNWNHFHGFHDFHHFHNHFLFSPFFFGAGFWSPFWWSLGPSYGWNSYPYCEYYYGSDYGYTPTAYVSASDYVAVEPTPAINEPSANEQSAPPSVNQPPTDEQTDWGVQYLGGARDAFQQGSYADALRLAGHAAIEMPQNVKPHEIASLAAFALKDYRTANLEAHAALALGEPADWRTLYTYYGDLPTYRKQLDALVDYVREHKDAADARFVLAYHDLMMGHKDAAKSQFEKVLAKIPQDQLAAGIVKKLGGTAPSVTPTPPVPAASAAPPVEEKPKAEEPAKSF
jgi:tetratricopeptide (TPR) repeat protein